ncbi:MAG TPA: hypothetical protein PK228_12795, partial [Saprospiraceae bacterium]|nr:hypothetical protein [Saprospiraceae bacterium]
PWRFSPASPNLDRLRPWLFLMVLKEGEFTINTASAGGQAPTVTIQTFELPIDQAWAWAHVQVNKALAANNNDPVAINTELETLLKDDPDIAFSRILCPRKLEKNTRYQAFLLPYFESGRKAGLGEADPYSGIDRLQPAWPALGSATLPFPFYHSWSFATSEGGDIENLARRLQVFNPEDLKLPTVDISSLITAFGADPTKASDLLDFSAALMPPGYSLPVWPGNNKPEDIQLKESLRVRINRNTPADASSLTADPVVNVPPMYGQWHAAVNQLLAPSNSSGGINQFGSSSNNSDNLRSKKGLGTWIFPLPRPWLYELNLDPRYRAIAALGTETVRKNQEKFMDDAWEQVGAIIEAIQLLRQAQLAIEVNKKMLAKHVESRSANDTVTLMAALHGKIKKA